MRAQNGPGKAEAQQAKADQGLAKLGGLIESSVDDQGLLAVRLSRVEPLEEGPDRSVLGRVGPHQVRLVVPRHDGEPFADHPSELLVIGLGERHPVPGVEPPRSHGELVPGVDHDPVASGEPAACSFERGTVCAAAEVDDLLIEHEG